MKLLVFALITFSLSVHAQRVVENIKQKAVITEDSQSQVTPEQPIEAPKQAPQSNPKNPKDAGRKQ